MTRKNMIQANLRAYLQRREEVRKKFPDWRPKRFKSNKEYLRRVKKLNYRIIKYRLMIKRIEKHEAILRKVEREVCAFFSIRTLWNTCSRKGDRTTKIPLNFLCKYAIESGCCGRVIADYIRSNIRTPSSMRRSLNKKLAKDAILKKKWQDFRQFRLHEQKKAA